jgi:DNA ligase-1
MTTLYKSAKTGAIQSWSIEAIADSFIVTFGQLGGAMQTVATKCFTKNPGRSNETTPEQQAVLEMEALIAKKLKSGYSTDPAGPTTVALPMKVKCYQDQLHNIILPTYSTPKLNGVNGTYRRNPSTNQLTLTSRGGELYPAIPHLEPLILSAMIQLGSDELNLELYIHGLPLQDITSAVVKPNHNSKLLSACIFDLADSKEPYEARRKLMLSYLNFNYTAHSSVCVLAGKQCSTTEAIESHYKECMSLGLEGTVIKNAKALYQHNVRSSDMFKYKKAQDAEWEIVGYELDKRNHPVFILITNELRTFKAKPKGTHEFLASIAPDTYVGQFATIEFEVLSKDLIPLKPIFIGLRKCDSNGDPLV